MLHYLRMNNEHPLSTKSIVCYVHIRLCSRPKGSASDLNINSTQKLKNFWISYTHESIQQLPVVMNRFVARFRVHEIHPLCMHAYTCITTKINVYHLVSINLYITRHIGFDLQIIKIYLNTHLIHNYAYTLCNYADIFCVACFSYLYNTMIKLMMWCKILIYI